MNNDKNNLKRSELGLLMEAEAANAEYRMRQCGHAGIVFTMITATGINVMPGIFGEAELETFVTTLRLSSIAEGARVGVLTWQVLVTPLPAVSADNHPQWREGVLQCGETLSGIYSNRFLPILRGPGDRFTGFGPTEALPGVPMPTPFSHLLPTRAPSAEERQAAAKELAAMWVPADQVDWVDSSEPIKPSTNDQSNAPSVGRPGYPPKNASH